MTVKANATPNDITRTTLSVLSIGALIIAAFWILKPFLLAILWASMIVTATWPILLRVEKLLWGKRTLAALAMTLLLSLLVVAPLTMILGAMVANADRIVSWVESLSSITLMAPPHWVETLPAIGPKLAGAWRDVATSGVEGLSELLSSHAKEIASWFFTQTGNPGNIIFDFLLTLIASGILYSTGERAARSVLRFARRLAGDRGEMVVVLAGKSIRGLALGVVVTAVVQSIAGGIGLAVAGVPAVVLLSAVMFMFCLAQLGPSLVLVPAVIWLFWSGVTGWAIFLTVWTILITPIDNILRPMLIRKSVDLSLFVVFPGVIGGLMTLGIIGVFIGPVVLAVTCNLLVAWIKEGEEAENGEKAEAGEGAEK